VGSRGPAPKPDGQRAGHRKKSDRADVLDVPYVVKPPPLPHPEELHPQALAMYEAMAKSVQALRYEPSDWTLLQITVQLLSDELSPGIKPSAERLKVAMANLAKLGATQPDRLRQGLEARRPSGGTAKPAPPGSGNGDIERRFAAMAKAANGK
jgi:hypothetical protein